MDATTRPYSTERRGVVLVLVLAMLGLLAIIGVSFASFAGQARYSARIYSQKLATPRAEDVIDFGISQLINDTTNPMSDMYGHGLKRDMYGSDAYANGSLAALPNGLPLQMTAVTGTLDPNDGHELWAVNTNIPISLGIDFARWSAITQPNAGELAVKQTLEVVGWTNNSGNYRLTLSGSHVVPVFSNGYTLAEPAVGRLFVLEGRFLKAFNGWGISGPPTSAATALYPGEPQRDHDLRLALTAAGQPGNTAAGQYAKFRISGGLLSGSATIAPFNPNSAPMDEDYDAPDLENWFLAAQSADGSVVIPSFHRPGILVDDIDPNTGRTLDDWTLRTDTAPNAYEQLMALRAQSKILRPRAVDHPAAGTRTFPDLKPDLTGTPASNPNYGKINYDVDNDGDGTTDSVWIDLGYPAIRSPEGKLYKPLFSFMVLGLNGRIPLNTAGNLNARADTDDVISPLFNEAGMPLFDHVSHLGYSPSEINPKYVLQNGYTPSITSGTNDSGQTSHQFDNTGLVPVDLTQLRNLLGGTRLITGVPASHGDNNQVRVAGTNQFLPNNLADDQDTPATGPVPRAGAAVAGRWGEPAGLTEQLARFQFSEAVSGTLDTTYSPLSPGLQRYFRGLNYEAAPVGGAHYTATPTPIAAGRSPFANQQYRYDGIDDNYDSLDFFPQRVTPTTQPNPLVGPERGDPADATNWAHRFSTSQDLYVAGQPPSGLTMLPSERAAMFTTPLDPTGNGRVVRHNVPPTPGAYYGFGPDRWGRVGFFHYFRPPGVPQREDFFPNAGTAAAPSYVLALSNLNKTHGFVSATNPGGREDGATPRRFGGHMGAMPYNVSNQTAATAYVPTAPPTNLFDPATPGSGYIGTFNSSINSGVDATLDPTATAVADSATRNAFPFGGLRFNDPDEMNLYAPDGNDAPFGVSDLEWLLRRQDIDGSSLSSRLADLAPISLVHSPDSVARSRMLTTESWDRNNYSFPIDRARGATPSIAQGDRRINLNFPLPHSYDPYEPVRLKWISETYAFLKQVLPLSSIDTPEELSQLGQFVVNLIDYRDPDNAITVWTNPDVFQTPARVIAGTPEVHLQPEIHLPRLPGVDLNADGVNDANPLLSANYNAGLATPLVHYGMEYNPIAINEVLGFVYNYADPAAAGADRNARTSRLFIELTNTLSRDNLPTTPGVPDPASLDLEGWEFVLLKEDPATPRAAGAPYFHPAMVRPDPFSGQLPRVDTTAPDFDPPTVTRVSVGTGLDVTKPGAIAGLDPIIRGMDPDDESGDPKYYVLTGAKYAGDPPDTSGDIRTLMDEGGDQLDGDINFDGDNDGDGTDEPWDLVPDPADLAFADEQGLYHWLYIQRPANPLAPAGPNNPMVVVDSIRFPFGRSPQEGQNIARPAPPVDPEIFDQPLPAGDNPDNDTTDWLYSVERRQPFRGGQLVPAVSDPTWQTPSYAYGFSEQVRPSAPRTGGGGGGGRHELYGIYDTNLRQYIDGQIRENNDDNEDHKVHTTGQIHHTLGRGIPGDFDDNPWDYFHFNDRDFMSVSELTTVPGCPPGMFTKKFVETAGPLRSPDPAADPDFALNATPPPDRPVFHDSNDDNLPAGDTIRAGQSKMFRRENTHTYPYLVDKFFYSGTSFGDGWHRLLDVFEVPSPTIGSIGPVAGGVNFDWYREDRRPGQINLNLVLDEEVFFSVLDDPRLLNLTAHGPSLVTDPQLPRVVTQVDQNGTPKVSYPMANRGFTTFTDATYAVVDLNPTTASFPIGGMKRAFADFLKLRHGGSGFLFGHGNGPTGTPFIQTPTDPAFDDSRIAADKPFRSLAYPDINQTLLRPATLPPSAYTLPALDPVNRPDLIDPGVRNLAFPRDDRTNNPQNAIAPLLPGPNVPPIPYRRLFQVPDTLVFGSDPDHAFDNNQSNASLRGQVPTAPDTLDNPVTEVTIPGTYPLLPVTNMVNGNNDFLLNNPAHPEYAAFQVSGPSTTEPVASLFQDGFQHLGQHNITTGSIPVAPPNPAMFTVTPPTVIPPAGGTEEMDLRRHPYYRTELLSKMMNLTTPRTHQFAVWVTVGYFEIAEAGDPTKLIPDKLGRELGAASGNATRYRSFFVLDRTRATGYDPLNPGDYRDVILYSRRIE